MFSIVNQYDTAIFAFIKSSLYRIGNLRNQLRSLVVDLQSVDKNPYIINIIEVLFFEKILDTYHLIFYVKTVKTLLQKNVEMFFDFSSFR